MTGFDTRYDARPAAPSEGSPLDPEHLLAGIEPELKEVIDVAVARVAEVERAAVQQAQQQIARSDQEAREAYAFALARSSELASRLEVLAAAVTDMSSALLAETDAVVQSLHGMRKGLADRPAEADPPRDAAPGQVAGVPVAEPAPSEAPPEPPPEMSAPDPDVEPSAELTQVFREQITRMRQDGKSRDEAERVLLRFRLGHRFLGMLDEVYSSDPQAVEDGRRSGLIRRFRSQT